MAKATKSIAILGAGGSMGTWFSKYFIALKYSVTGFDSENAIKVKGVIGANSLVGAILTKRCRSMYSSYANQHARLLR